MSGCPGRGGTLEILTIFKQTFHWSFGDDLDLCLGPSIVLQDTHTSPGPSPLQASGLSHPPPQYLKQMPPIAFALHRPPIALKPSMHCCPLSCFLSHCDLTSFFISLLILECTFVFCLFCRAGPAAYGGSQARGLILRQSHSKVGSELHLRPIPQLMAMPDT